VHGRATHAVTDRVANGAERTAGSGNAIVDTPLKSRVESEPAAALVEVDPRQTGVELLAEERRRVGLSRRVGGQQLVDQGIDERLVVGHVEHF
jgi:hypothetical protein